MNKNGRSKGLLLLCANALLLASLTGSFAFVWYTSYSDEIVLPFFRKGNWLVIAVYAVLSMFFARVYGGMRIGQLKKTDVIYSNALSLLFVHILTYLQISLIGRRFLPVMPMITLTGVDFLITVLWTLSTSALLKKLYPPREMLLVYGSGLARSLVRKIGSRRDKYRIGGRIDIAEGLERVKERMAEYDSVLLCDIKSETRNKLLKYCFDRGIRVYITPKISDIIIRSAQSNDLFDTPLLLCRNFGLTTGQSIVKRAVDIVFASLALLLFSPAMLLISAIILLRDGRPVFYQQTRLTRGGKSFALYKFRSMVVNAEEDGRVCLAGKNDSRITPVGRVLRKFRLDEVPQIYNILRGDMSIVGPRPERPELAARFERGMPEFSFRLKVKAGLTGYAQVMGRYSTTAYDKLKYDLYYIGNYSIFLDFKIMLMTVKILFMKERAEGVRKQDLIDAAKY